MTTSPQYMLNVDALAPLREPKRRVVAPLADVPRPSSLQISIATNTIAASGLLEMLTPLLPYMVRKRRGIHTGGRQPIMTLNALLAGCLILTLMERPLIIRDVHRLLNEGIDAGTKKHLGLEPKSVITERMVSRLFNIIAALVNVSVYSEANAWLFDKAKVETYLGLDDTQELDSWEHAYFIDQVLQDKGELLEAVIRAGLKATIPTDTEHAGDYAIDGTLINSWENPRKSRRSSMVEVEEGVWIDRVQKPAELSDPDARVWARGPGIKSKRRNSQSHLGDSGLGYVLTAITWAEKDLGPGKRGPDVPILIEHLSLRPSGGRMALEGVRLIEKMCSFHESDDQLAHRPDRERGDILSDREYSHMYSWHRSMHVLGFVPHFYLTQKDRGVNGNTAAGILLVDGIPYSPGMPEELRITPPVRFFATREEKARDATFYALRAPYRIRAHQNRRQANGSITAYCPASSLAGRAIACPNKPASIKGRLDRIEIGTSLPVISTEKIPLICEATKVVIDFDEFPLWQPHIPGSTEHTWSMNRRSTAEGAFSRIKDETGQSMRRGQVRLMGRAKMGLAALFYAMAANIKEVERWKLRQAGVFSLDSAREIKTRMPRRHIRSRKASALRRSVRRTKEEVIAELAEKGFSVDLETGEIKASQDPPPQ